MQREEIWDSVLFNSLSFEGFQEDWCSMMSMNNLGYENVVHAN